MTQRNLGLLPLTLFLVAAPERTQIGLLATLATVASIQIVGQAPSLADQSSLAGLSSAAILLIDIYGETEPDYSQLSTIRRQYPTLSVIVLTPRHRRGILDRLYRLGVRGFITEDVGLPALVDALTAIRNNSNIFIVRIGG